MSDYYIGLAVTIIAVAVFAVTAAAR